MGSPCLFTRQQVLKKGYFYWLRVKNSNHLHTEFSLGNLKDTKFYFEIKASFIKIKSIASCYLFLIAWLWGFCTFSVSSVVSLKSSPLSKYAKYGTIFKKNHVLLSTFFPYSNMFFIRMFLANTWKKSRVSPCLFPHKLPWKVDMVLRTQSGWRICAVRTGTRHKMAPIVFEVCTWYQACFRLFLCVWSC